MILQRRTRSILDELANMPARQGDKKLITENRALHVIQSAIHLLSYLKENYDPETASDLEKRLINSIRTADANKFIRGVRKVKNEN
jgi:hypothetical protein